VSTPFEYLKDSLDVAQGAYVQAADPGVGPAKRLWIDITDDLPALKKRNDDDDGFDLLGYIFNPAQRTIAGAGAVTNDDLYVFIDVSGGSFSVSLMDLATRKLPLFLKVLNGSTGNVATIDPSGAQTIEGEATMPMAEGDRMTILPRNSTTNWEIIQ